MKKSTLNWGIFKNPFILFLAIIGVLQFILVLAIIVFFVVLFSWIQFPAYKNISILWKPSESPIQTFIDPYYENEIFRWQKDTYSITSRPRRYDGEEIDYFTLKKNDRLVWSLKSDKNEMRFAQFFDCQTQLCIFGMGAVSPTTAGSDDAVAILLWPSKKRLTVTRPCIEGGAWKSIDTISVTQRSVGKFGITAQCREHKNDTETRTWTETSVDVTKFL